MNPYNLLSSLVDDHINCQKTKFNSVNPCALVIVFNQPTMIDLFLKAITLMEHNFMRQGDYLIVLKESYVQAQALGCSINSILYTYDTALISAEFTPDWLPAFLKANRFGVDVAMAAHQVTSLDQIHNYLTELDSSSTKQHEYQGKIRAAEAQALNYTDSDLVEDLFTFIECNWQGFTSTTELHAVIEELIAQLHLATQNEYFFSRFPAQKTLRALKQKASFLNEQQDQDAGKRFERIENQGKIEGEFQGLINNNPTHKIWTEIAQGLSHHAIQRFPSMTSALQEGLHAASPQRTPWRGLDLSYDPETDLNKRLAAPCIGNGNARLGRNVIKILTETIAAFYLKLMEIKQEVKFETMLVDHSKIMNKAPFFDHWLNLAAQSRPNLKN